MEGLVIDEVVHTLVGYGAICKAIDNVPNVVVSVQRKILSSHDLGPTRKQQNTFEVTSGQVGMYASQE